MNQLIVTIKNFLALGGPVVSILLVLSVIAVALILLKLFQFWREGVGNHTAAQRALSSWIGGNTHEALVLTEGRQGLVAAAAALCMRNLNRASASKSEIEGAVETLASSRLHSLQRGFRALDAIAQVAPLLGLFGTVLGMIEAFQKLQGAGNAVDPSILAGGIWVALMTTAVGLAVAMPVSLVLTWFEIRLEDERVATETIVGHLLNASLMHPQSRSAESASGDFAHAH